MGQTDDERILYCRPLYDLYGERFHLFIIYHSSF